MKRLLVVEPDAGGHHFIPYLLFFAREAIARGIEVHLLTTASAMRHAAFAMLRESLPAALMVHAMPELPQASAGGIDGLMRRQWNYWRAVASGFAGIPRDTRPDHVFVLSMDGLDRVTALRGSPFGRTPFSGLFVHLKFHWGSLGIAPPGRFPAVQERLFSHLLGIKSLHSMATIDASLPDWWWQRHPRNAHKLRYVPDPGQIRLVDGREEARKKLGLRPDGQVVLSYGNISATKNLAALLRAAQVVGEPVMVVVAGKVEADVKRDTLASADAEVLRAAGQLHVFDGFADLDMEQRLFAAADVLWLGYARHFCGQSAVLAQAASAGRPVLAREGGWIGWMTQQHGLGLCAEPTDADAVAAALGRLRSDAVLAADIRAATQRFSVERSESAFAAAMMACIPDVAGWE
ncbi:MAG: glycosyltransferase [Pseudoxanthomonas sp.]